MTQSNLSPSLADRRAALDPGAGASVPPSATTHEPTSPPAPPVKRQRPPLISFWLWSLPVLFAVLASLPYVAGFEDINLPLMGTVYDQSAVAIALGVWGVGLWASLTGYLLPTLIAYGRRTTNRASVAILNILLGWSVIGWVIALAMSLLVGT